MKRIIAWTVALVLLATAGIYGYQYYSVKSGLGEIESSVKRINKELEDIGVSWKRNHLYSVNVIDSLGSRSYLSLVCSKGEFKILLTFGRPVVVNSDGFTLTTSKPRFDSDWLINISNTGLVLEEPSSIELANELKSGSSYLVTFKASYREIAPNFHIVKDQNPINDELKKCKS
jgi:hypothetical protein